MKKILLFLLSPIFLFSETLQGPDQDNVWIFIQHNSVSLNGVFHKNISDVVGGKGNDTFVFEEESSLSGMLNGGGGKNTLDYSSYSKNIFAHLGEKTVTGLGSFLNISHLIGTDNHEDSIQGPNRWNIWALPKSGSPGFVSGYDFEKFDNVIGGKCRDGFIIIDEEKIPGIIDGGKEGTSTIYGPDEDNIWLIDGKNSGSINEIHKFINMQNLYGGLGNDTFFLLEEGSCSGKINGEVGNNILIIAKKNNTIRKTGERSGIVDENENNEVFFYGIDETKNL
jgi:hypothetical protein